MVVMAVRMPVRHFELPGIGSLRDNLSSG
jgi:hypothetical protein